MKIIEYYIYYSSDGYRHTPIAYFANKSDAETMVNGSHYHGIDGPRQIIVFDNVDEYNKHHTDELRKSALNKLSDDEKKALGL